MTRFARFVALGDSTVEGLDDPYPGGSGYRGWADRLAERLAAVEPSLAYANLAVRGRKMAGIRASQLPAALALEPDLAVVVGGMNDMLRRSWDPDGVLADLEAIVAGLRGAGATVLSMTFGDPGIAMPAARGMLPRVTRLNDGMREIAARHDVLLADFERRGVIDRRLWAADRLHLNAHGHERVAAAFAHVLDLPGADESWTVPLPEPAPSVPRARAVAADVAWATRFMAPWVVRRVRGRSSGDGVEPKRPELAPVRLP